MKIQRGIVQYQDRNDIECLYGVLDDNTQYYFMDNTGKTLSNGNIIASTSLTEAIDPMHEPKEIGLIDPQGNIVIPFENKSIKSINDDLILVEKAVPVSQSVIDACKIKNDPLSATNLVSTAATIKANLNSLTMSQGEYIFNDMFSEATLCDNNGNNLLSNEYYSFITMTSDKIFFSKNTVDSQIVEYTLVAPQVSNQVENNNAIDVNNINVDAQQVDNALQQGETISDGDVTISGSELQTNPVDLNTSENNVDVQSGANDLSSQQPIQDTTQLIGDSLASEGSQSIENGVIQVSDQLQQNVVQGEESTNIADTNDSNNEVVVDRESNSDISNINDGGLLSQNGEVSKDALSNDVFGENTELDDNQNDDGLNDEIQQVDEQMKIVDENNNVTEDNSSVSNEVEESNNDIVEEDSVDNDNSDKKINEDESNTENNNDVVEESNLEETGESVSEDLGENSDSKEEVQDNSVDLVNDDVSEVSKNLEEKVIDENELLNSVVNNGEEINETEEEHDDTVSLNLNQDNNNVTDDTVSLNLNQDNNNVTDDTISLDLNQANNDEADDVTDSVEMDDINTSLENGDLAEDGGFESIFNKDMGTDIFEDSIARADSIRDEDDDFSDSYDDGEVDNSMPVSDTVSNINRLIRGYKKLQGEVFNLKSEVKQLRSKNRAQTEQMKKAVIVINKENAKNKKLLSDNRELQRENAKKDKKIIMLTNQVKSYNEVEKILGNINVELDDYDDSSSYRMAA